ncbi:hypothetical protein [Maribacter sp. 2210JD10-5]|uniref:hypothetical protein n=1 Tax=Maribacter sp. 2210JD10-5 TaxID=3386272 RepID=UPI0039BCE956
MKLKKIPLFLLLIVFSSCITHTDEELKNIAIKFLDDRLASPELLDYKIERHFDTYNIEINDTDAWKTKHPQHTKVSFPLFIEINASDGQVISFL